MAESKGLAITALALGILGLFTLGGLGVGSLLGLVLAAVALASARAGRDVAWSALAANLFALLTVLPLGTALWTQRQGLVAFVTQDDPLPEPAQRPAFSEGMNPEAFPPPPPPPPRSSPRVASKGVARQAEEAPTALPIRVGGEIQEPRKTRHVNPVKQWEYTPTLLNGVPVPVIMTVTVNFKLS